jgi:hypothetical protein
MSSEIEKLISDMDSVPHEPTDRMKLVYTSVYRTGDTQYSVMGYFSDRAYTIVERKQAQSEDRLDLNMIYWELKEKWNRLPGLTFKQLKEQHYIIL